MSNSMSNKKKTMYVWSAAIMSLLLLSACSSLSLSKEQCLSGNWQAIGYSDGVTGHYPTHISEHQKACAETGIIPDFQTWEKGRKQGLVHYCTEANALRLGQEGRGFNGVCPGKKVNRLQSIHNKAYRKYARQRKIDSNNRKITRYRDKLNKLRSGDMLDFGTEIEAREYMLKLQSNIHELERENERNYSISKY